MSGTARYNRRSTDVKRPPASDQLLVALGPNGEGEVLVLTANGSLAEITRRLRRFCRAVVNRRPGNLGRPAGEFDASA